MVDNSRLHLHGATSAYAATLGLWYLAFVRNLTDTNASEVDCPGANYTRTTRGLMMS